MTDPNGADIYGVPWIPSKYPLYVNINIPAPWILWVRIPKKNRKSKILLPRCTVHQRQREGAYRQEKEQEVQVNTHQQ